MQIFKTKTVLVFLGVLVGFSVAYARYNPEKVSEEIAPEGMVLPEGCKEIYRMKNAVFVRCIVKGNWTYLATITTRGVTMGAPVKITL